MQEGFAVRLSSITDFAEAVAGVANDYAAIATQLTQADLTKSDPNFESLLGKSHHPGSTEINNSCRAMLSQYAALYSELCQTHDVIKKRLEYVVAALAETHQLYADVDATHDTIFRSILNNGAGN